MAINKNNTSITNIKLNNLMAAEDYKNCCSRAVNLRYFFESIITILIFSYNYD